jgi:hypothetical protein
MPATAAVLDEVRIYEQKIGIENLVEYAVTHTRFVTALDGKIVEETILVHDK